MCNAEHSPKNLEETETFEPGAARFGNFINYYSFNSVEKRTKVIPKDLLQQLGLLGKVVCLDVGCNAGDLTVGLYSHLLEDGKKSDLFFFGIDLDSTLITRCVESNPYPSNIYYQHLDIMNDDTASNVLNKYLVTQSKNKFDLITCFAVTMWVHLNHGDTGLYNFLKKLSESTNYLLLEHQEWKCYKSASRRMKRLKREFFDLSKLTIKDKVTEHIAHVLKECGMEQIECFGKTSWNRKLYLYKHKVP